MPDSLSHLIGSQVRHFTNLPLHGSVFRRYAPQSRPAPAGDRTRIAIPYLIPNLGDTVMLFPLVDALRRSNPEAEISCFTQGGSRILGLHPAVGFHYELTTKPDWRYRFGRAGYIYDLYRQWHDRFLTFQFHHVAMLRAGVDPFHSAHLGWMLGGHQRAGYSSCVEPERAAYDLEPDELLTLCIRDISRIHEVQRGSEILERAGLISAPVNVHETVQSILSIANNSEGQTFMASHPELQRPYAVIAPGSSFPRRRWDTARFAEVTRRTIVSRGWMPVLVGGHDDLLLCSSMAEQLPGPVLNLAGKTVFAQLAAVCAGATCFLGNDSGTGHVAGACGTPTLVVAMFRRDGPATHHSSPLRTHPVGPRVRVVQAQRQVSPCVDECEMDYAHCILDVAVDEVCIALNDLLSNIDPGANHAVIPLTMQAGH